MASLFLQDEGIVLRKRPFREKDEIVIFFTKEHGKMAFMSYGSRDPKSRKAGALQLFNTVSFQARKGKSALPVFDQVKVVTSRGISLVEQGIDAFYRASEMTQMTDKFIKELQMVQKGYEELNFCLDKAKSMNMNLIYGIRLLTHLGFLPDWRICVFCHVRWHGQDSFKFSTENRGFAHQNCCQKKADTHSLSMFASADVVKVMSFWQSTQLEKTVKVELSEALSKKIRGILELMVSSLS